MSFRPSMNLAYCPAFQYPSHPFPLKGMPVNLAIALFNGQLACLI